VVNCRLVVEPRTRISRGFAFVTMDCTEDADRCIKYLNQSVLEGRYITVEKVILAFYLKIVHRVCALPFIFDLEGFDLYSEDIASATVGSNQMISSHPNFSQTA
jgi:RNA recognition motif-containing protein